MSSGRGGSDECPICLSPPSDSVETNCAHKYCAGCIVSYWESTNRYPLACKCPYCRREINLLMPVGAIRDGKMQQKINEYNRQMGGASIPMYTQVRDTPTLLRHVLSELVSTRGLSFCNRVWIIVLMIFAMVYVISPIDLIPELLFGPIGYIDDIGSVIALIMYVVQIYRQDMSTRTSL